jgi:putative transposase
MIDKNYDALSVRQQCQLLGLNRSSLYYEPVNCTSDSILLNQINDLWMKIPSYGYRRICAHLKRDGIEVNRKRVQRLMQEAGLEAIYQKPKMSVGNKEHVIYPYLLRGLIIDRPNQVWVTDITYIKMPRGFVYLMAIMDVFSRKVIAWDVGNSMDLNFCLPILEKALMLGTPDIFNTDQGSQFTSQPWINMVQEANVQVSMDGKGRWADNIPIERFWRTVKWEHLFLCSNETIGEVHASIAAFISFYNFERVHQSLDYNTPMEVFTGIKSAKPVILGLPKAGAEQKTVANSHNITKEEKMDKIAA